MFKVNNKDTRTTPMVSFWYLYCYFWTYFTLCSSASIVNFEHAIACWVRSFPFSQDLVILHTIMGVFMTWGILDWCGKSEPHFALCRNLFVRDCYQILLKILMNLRNLIRFYFPLKTSENLRFANVYKMKKGGLIRLNFKWSLLNQSKPDLVP